MPAYLSIDSISVSFGASAPVLDRVSLEVRRGEMVALLGSSGCGKTTLLRSIAGFVKPSTGRIVVDGRDLTDGGDVAVFRTAADEVFALADRCPHKGGPLSQGFVYGRRVACPLHNWSISLEDGTVQAPDRGCTAHYPVKVEDGVVYADLSRRAMAEPAPASESAA